jgi:hypothetical protein
MATTEETTWEILAAESTTATQEVTIVEAASSGTSAPRTLTHPDAANFPIVTYNRNPARTINFDQTPLSPPSSETIRTLGTTQAFVTQNALDDVIVTEIWPGDGGQASMEASFFRRLYELCINPPNVEDPEIFIEWAPKDRTSTVYNVILLDIRVGGSPQKLDVKEWGSYPAGTLDAVATGIIDRTVELDLKIVSEV